MEREETEARPERKRMTLVEWIAVIAIIGILAAVAIPQLLDARETARTAVCDNIYVALLPMGHDDPTLEELSRACGGAQDMAAIVECALRNHTDEDNPRDRHQRAYTGDPITPDDSCQVHIAPIGTNGIRFSQYVRPDSHTSRSFSVTID